jgi:hypothetical protein
MAGIVPAELPEIGLPAMSRFTVSSRPKATLAFTSAAVAEKVALRSKWAASFSVHAEPEPILSPPLETSMRPSYNR